MNSITREEFAKIIKVSRIKPRLKRDLRFAPEEIKDWQSRDFLAVMNRSKSEGVLIVQYSEITAYPFKLERRVANSTGRTEAIICDICATWQRGSNSAAMIFTKEKSSTTYLVCRDLECSLHVRDKTPQAILSRTQLREDIEPSGRLERLHARLFAILDAVI